MEPFPVAIQGEQQSTSTPIRIRDRFGIFAVQDQPRPRLSLFEQLGAV
jgi:hypothetical protein